MNFKDVADDYKIIVDGQISDCDEIIKTFKSRLQKPLALFKKYTDEMLKTSKIKKILEKQTSNKK